MGGEISCRICLRDSSEVKEHGTVDRLLVERRDMMRRICDNIIGSILKGDLIRIYAVYNWRVAQLVSDQSSVARLIQYTG
jgi:hypothetical protein